MRQRRINLFPRCPGQFSWSLSSGDKSRGRVHVSVSIRAIWLNTWSCLILKWTLLCQAAKRKTLLILTVSGTTCACSCLMESWKDKKLLTDHLAALWGVPRKPRRLRQTGGHTPADWEADQETWDPPPQPRQDTARTWAPWPKRIPQPPSIQLLQQATEQASVQYGDRCCWGANSWARPRVLCEEEALLLQV